MISQLACRPLVRAFAEHDAETITREKAPSLGIDRILAESKNVHVVTRRYLEIADG
jgi:hypothetical protein